MSFHSAFIVLNIEESMNLHVSTNGISYFCVVGQYLHDVPSKTQIWQQRNFSPVLWTLYNHLITVFLLLNEWLTYKQ